MERGLIKKFHGTNIQIQGMTKDQLERAKHVLTFLEQAHDACERRATLLSESAMQQEVRCRVHYKLDDSTTVFFDIGRDKETGESTCALNFLKNVNGQQMVFTNVPLSFLAQLDVPKKTQSLVEAISDRAKGYVERVNASIAAPARDAISPYIAHTQQATAR